MKDSVCIEFLQWALPQLQMRWPGFRRVHRQVCNRLKRRLRQLKLDDLDAYRSYLEAMPDEWHRLDQMCRITVTRFYRDKRVFELMGEAVLPNLAQKAINRGDTTIRCWSAGCAGGEEAYTLALVWHFVVKQNYPHININIMATDIDPRMLERAQRGIYTWSGIKALPADWRSQAFTSINHAFQLDTTLCANVHFHVQDIRQAMTAGPFDLIMCRNLAFTYFDEGLQQQILEQLRASLLPGGVLVLGSHEALPELATGFQQWQHKLPIYCIVDSEKDIEDWS